MTELRKRDTEMILRATCHLPLAVLEGTALSFLPCVSLLDAWRAAFAAEVAGLERLLSDHNKHRELADL